MPAARDRHKSKAKGRAAVALVPALESPAPPAEQTEPSREQALPVITRVDYLVGGQSTFAYCTNLSSTGLFIRNARQLTVGQKLEIKLHLRAGAKPVAIRGEIRRLDTTGKDPGAEVAFVRGQEATLKAVRRFLEENQVDQLESSVRRSLANTSSLVKLAAYYAESGRRAEALELYRKGLEALPNSQKLYEGMASLGLSELSSAGPEAWPLVSELERVIASGLALGPSSALADAQAQLAALRTRIERPAGAAGRHDLEPQHISTAEPEGRVRQRLLKQAQAEAEKQLAARSRELEVYHRGIIKEAEELRNEARKELKKERAELEAERRALAEKQDELERQREKLERELVKHDKDTDVRESRSSAHEELRQAHSRVVGECDELKRQIQAAREQARSELANAERALADEKARAERLEAELVARSNERSASVSEPLREHRPLTAAVQVFFARLTRQPARRVVVGGALLLVIGFLLLLAPSRQPEVFEVDAVAGEVAQLGSLVSVALPSWPRCEAGRQSQGSTQAPESHAVAPSPVQAPVVEKSQPPPPVTRPARKVSAAKPSAAKKQGSADDLFDSAFGD